MDQVCPRCKTTKYRNPNMKLMVNVCGHNICETCVELLFVKGSGACPECNIPLRRTNFRLQLFEDANVDKEVDIRRRILKDFNKQEEDFDSLRGYNDYLEMVEDIIFNLTNNLDILETNKKIQQYKDENKDNIMKNRSRLSKDSQELLDILSMEEKFSKQVQLEMKVLEDAEKVAKIKNKEKLIDDLMFGEADANQILEQHREMVSAEERSKAMFSTGLDLEAGPAQGSGAAQAGGVVQDPLFEYQETLVDLMGPSLPRMEALEGDPGLNYLRHMRPATEAERSGGYMEQLGCYRALQEAMAGLFYVPGK